MALSSESQKLLSCCESSESVEYRRTKELQPCWQWSLSQSASQLSARWWNFGKAWVSITAQPGLADKLLFLYTRRGCFSSCIKNTMWWSHWSPGHLQPWPFQSLSVKLGPWSVLTHQLPEFESSQPTLLQVEAILLSKSRKISSTSYLHEVQHAAFATFSPWIHLLQLQKQLSDSLYLWQELLPWI